LETLRQIQGDNGKAYTVVDDFTSVYRAVITGVVTDEILGELSVRDLTIQVDRPDLAIKTTRNGLFALTGYPNTTGYTVHVTASAAGFRDLTVAVPVPANPTSPVSAPLMALRRRPVTVQGRVVADTAQRLPIAGARIVLVDNPSTPPALHSIALRSPLLLSHAAGATVREITMNGFGGTTLHSGANSGTRVLDLSTTAGLGVNSVLQFANALGTRVEYRVVESVGLVAGQVFLRQPLNATFASGAAVQFLNPGALGATTTLGLDADAGDGVLMASLLLTGATLEIDPGTASVEYHETGALTDADGYYGISGVGRAPELFFEASHLGFTSMTRDWFVEYDNAVNIVDFRL
jgi:hypothetical protein